MTRNTNPRRVVNDENLLDDNATIRAIRGSAPTDRTAIPTAILQDSRLSASAIGALCDLLSRAGQSGPVAVSQDALARRWRVGRHKAGRILNELLRSGYLIRGPRDRDKRFQYFLDLRVTAGGEGGQ